MKRYRFDMEKEEVLKLLTRELEDLETAERICRILEELSIREKCEKRLKQIEGIRKAKEKGVALGRPRLKAPDNFENIIEEWEQGNLRAIAAARACGMGISTFYRRARVYLNKK